MVSNFPGQSSRWCGQAIHTPCWRSHYAGMRYPSSRGTRDSDGLPSAIMPSIYESLAEVCVAVDAAVAQKRPVPANVFQFPQVALRQQDFLLVVGGFGQDASKGVAQEGASPKLQALARRAAAPDIAPLMSHPVDDAHKNAVGNGVRTLDGAPGIVLRGPELLFLLRMPADGGGIKQDIRPLERREAGPFRIPLVPANQRSEPSMTGVECLESQVAGREVIFLVIQGVVGDMHLAIEALEASVGVEDGGGIVVKPARPPLKDRGDNHHSFFLRDPRHAFRGGAGNGFGQVEKLGGLTLAEVLRAKQLRQTNDLRPSPGRFTDLLPGAIQIFVGLGRTRHLDQPGRKNVRRHASSPFETLGTD